MNSTNSTFDPSLCKLPSIQETSIVNYKNLLMFYICSLILLCILILIGNSIIIWSFIRVKKLRDKKYILIGSLCLSDFCAGIIIPIQILAPPSFMDAIGLSLSVISVFTNLAIAVERFYMLVLMNMFMSRTAATGKQLITICVVLWVTVLVAIVPWTAKPYTYILILYSFAPFSVIVVMTCVSILYISIFYTMHQMDKRKQSKLGKKDFRRTRLVVEAYAVIVIMFAVCWLPWCIAALQTGFSTYFSSDHSKREVCYVASIPAIFLFSIGLLNSAINPLIYWFKLPDFHNAINSLPIFKRFKCKRCQVASDSEKTQCSQ